MMDLLVLKERIKIIFQKYELYLEPLIKFIMAFIVFLIINANLGYNPKLKSMVVVFLLSMLSAFTPSSILVLLAALVTVGHVYSVSKILSLIVIFIFFILYFMFAKFASRQGYVILAIPVLFAFKVPYLIPILLGIIATPVAIIPSACGVIVYFLIKVIKEAAEITTNISMEDTLELYRYVVDGLINNKDMMLTLTVFSIVILATYSIRKMSFDHAFDIAIVAGAVVNILGFLIGDLSLDVTNHILGMILGTIISALLVYLIQFFRLTLEYTGVERVQFEDDDYYYYVKAVPKINVTTPKKDIKRFSGKKVTETETEKTEEDPFDEL